MIPPPDFGSGEPTHGRQSDGGMNLETVNWRENYRVRIGAALGILFICRARPRNLFFLLLGLAVSALGILLRQWAAGCLVKNDELARSGPYSFVRNPLYLGSLLAALGLILASTSFSHIFILKYPYFDRSLLFWSALWIMIDSIYLPKIEKEERLLKEKFGVVFENYAGKVPRILPRLADLKKLDFSSFNAELWKKNEEFWSIAGYLLICAFLIAGYIIR